MPFNNKIALLIDDQKPAAVLPRGQHVFARHTFVSGVSIAVLALALAGAPAWSQQLPTGGAVAAGNASIAQPNAHTLNINQSTNQAIINWQSFSVGQGGTVNFNQPNSSSATLNRVLGSTPSSIAGAINAPGTVLLVNPNGIAITKSGVINTGSFAASTLDIKDSDFLSGNYKFTGNGGSAAVTNAGRINVSDGGFAALLGGQVGNSGVISARLGKVGLGAGELITLDFAGDGFLSVAVPSSEVGKLVDQNGALVTNSGKIRADGGQVFLSAATANTILRDAVHVPGSIRANTVGTREGKIVLGGGAGGKVNVTGKLAARTKRDAVAGAGGKIDVSGRDIVLAGARFDVSGASGGGNIRIGGDAHGGGTFEHARTVSIDSASVIRADALGSGDGGTVIVWSDKLTTFAGQISARGGAQGGNGGFAEVSGKEKLGYTGFADLRATQGKFGTLLLDPSDIIIDSGNGDDTTEAGGTYTGNLDISHLDVAVLSAALGAADVIVDASGGTANGSGSITVNSAVIGANGHNLTLNAITAITLNANVDVGAGTLALNVAGAGYAITQTGGGITAGTLAVVTNGGNATLTAATNAVTNLGPVSMGAGTLTLVNTGGLTVTGAVTANGGVALTTGAGGTLTINNTVNAGAGDISFAADQMTITDGVSTTGTIYLVPVAANTQISLGTGVSGGLVIDNNSLSQLGSASVLMIGKGSAGGAVNDGAIQIGQTSVQNARLDLFTLAGITLVDPLGMTVGGGTGALNVSAGGTVDLGIGIAVATVSGSTTSGHFIVRGGGGDLIAGPITTDGGEISVENPFGALTIAGNLVSNGGNILVGGGGFSGGSVTLSANVGAGTGSIGLYATNGSITQTTGALIGVDLIAIAYCNCGNITLDSATNTISGNVSLNTEFSGGSISFTNSVGYTVGGISSISYASTGVPLDLTLIGTGPGIRTMLGSGASVTLTAGGDIDQAGGFDDVIAADTLIIGSLPGANPNVALGNLDNLVNNLGTVAIGQGAFVLFNFGDLTITGAAMAGGGYLVVADGALTVNANIDTSKTTSGGATDGMIALAAACACSDLTLNADLNAGATGIIMLGAEGNVNQSSGTITADVVRADAVSGAVSLNSATNAFNSIWGTAGNNFSATTARALTVSGSGIVTLSGAISLAATGTTSDIVVDAVVDAGSTVTLLAGRDLALGSSALINSLGSGDAIVLSAVRNFTNNAGAGALNMLGSGRWLIYANNPTNSIFGGLDSGNAPIWNATYASLPPASVPAGATPPGNRSIFAVADPLAPQPPGPNNPPSQFVPPGNNPANPGVNIAFQNTTGGPINVSFTPAPRSASNDSGTNVSPASLPDGVALATNNGLSFLPISQYDNNQYSQFALPGYADQAGLSAVFTMIARGADGQRASDYMIDTFWNGTAGAWKAGDANLSTKVTFSDGQGNTVVPNGQAGFPIVAGTTDFAAMLKTGPVMINGGGNPPHWLLATQMTPDGKGIVANDPVTGKQIVLAYDAATKSIGGVTGIFDGNTKKFVPIAEAAVMTPAIARLSSLQGFVATSYLAVTVK